MKIKVKRPRVTVGPVKISAPDPMRIVRDVANTAWDAAGDIIKGTGRGIGNIVREGSTAAGNVRRETNRAGTNIWRETVRTGEKVGDLGTALYRYGVGFVEGTGKTLSDAERRVREGKVFDAFFHLVYDPIVMRENLADRALNDSKYLNTIAATAATAYGGPYGAAAYTSWRTYRATGDPDRALRAGIIAGLTSAGMGEIGEIEGEHAALKKTILGGALGGAAIAASGGDNEAVLQGFLRAGGMVMVQDVFRGWTQQDLDPQGATGEAYCTAEDPESCRTIREAIKVDANGKRYLDGSMLDTRRSFVGAGSEGAILPPSLANDSSALMMAVAKVPGLNAMAFLHDHWAVGWAVAGTDPLSVTSIPPAIVLTYIGAGAPLYTKLVETSSATPAAAPVPATSAPLATGLPQPVRPTDPSVGRVIGVQAEPVEVAREAFATKEEMILAGDPLRDLVSPRQWPVPDRREKSPQPRAGVTARHIEVRILATDAGDALAEIATDPRYQMLDLLVRPGAGWLWARPEVPTDFSLRQHPGVILGEGGRIAPAPGWQWADEQGGAFALVPYAAELGADGFWRPASGWTWAWKDEVDLAVIREGLGIAPSGELFPLRGWNWQNPDDGDDVTVAAHGLARTESGAWQPLPGWGWEVPEDPHHLAVRQPPAPELNGEFGRGVPGLGWTDPGRPIDRGIIREGPKIG